MNRQNVLNPLMFSLELLYPWDKSNEKNQCSLKNGWDFTSRGKISKIDKVMAYHTLISSITYRNPVVEMTQIGLHPLILRRYMIVAENCVVPNGRAEPSIHFLYPLSIVRVAGWLEPIPVVIGREAGYTLDRSPVHHTRQTTTHTHTHS